MAILPIEQITQRFPRGIVAAPGVNLWESATNYAIRQVVVEDEVEAFEVEIAHMPVYEDQGGSAFTENGFVRNDGTGDAFGMGAFGAGDFGGDEA
jgi:hypothetical protein